MKTRQLLLIALVLTLPLAGARATLITSNTTLSPGDTNYEGGDLIVSNCTLTVNGAHSFTSLLLTNGAVLTHSPAPAGEPDDRLDLTIIGALTVDATSRVDANAKGYASGNGPGKGLAAYYESSSGGHGGPGGNSFSLAGGGAYDAVLSPAQWGSGGGNMANTPGPGGAGGGVIRLNVGGVLTVGGQLSANGEGTFDSGGAGGSIYLTVGTLAGAGTISAKGGDCGYVGSGGGGGGRIAVYYGSSTFSGMMSAAGGLSTGGRCGGVGTLYTKADSQSAGDLVLDNTGRTNAMETPITTPVAYRLTLTNATACVTEPLTLTGLRVSTNGLLTHPFQGPRLQVLVRGNAVVEDGGAVAADSRGYPANTGPGKGISDVEGVGSGAGHGGQGGASWSAPGGVIYDSLDEPVDFGSGGGGGFRPNRGGGAIQLTVEGTLAIYGRVSVNADTVTGGYDGGGAGGSVWLSAGRLSGGGSISANGQFATYIGAGSGGGGRIGIFAGVNLFTGSVTASGGLGGYRTGRTGSFAYATNGPSGLVSWWSGDGHCNDIFGTNHGTPVGGVNFAPGKMGQAFSFNGAGSFVDAGTNEVFNFNGGNGDLTIEAWINLVTLPPSSAGFVSKDTEGPYSGWSFYCYSDGRLGFGGAGVWEFVTAPGVVRAGVWSHVAVVKSGSSYSLYCDGSLAASTNHAEALETSTASLKLGTSLQWWMDGVLDEVGIYTNALSPTQIAGLYNTRPALPAQPDRTIPELTTLTVTNTASDPGVSFNTLTYALLAGPANATINANTGVISWIPSEAQGPGSNLFITVVTDNGVPPLSDTNQFSVLVNEINQAPGLADLSDRIVNPGETISFTATASDPDLPANALSFSLVNPPQGASMDPDNGLFHWRPAVAQADTTNTVQVQVTDFNPDGVNSQHLVAMKTFAVKVNPLAPVLLTPLPMSDGRFQMQISGTVGPDYVVQSCNALTNWWEVWTNTPVSTPFLFTETNANPPAMQFYRVRLRP